MKKFYTGNNDDILSDILRVLIIVFFGGIIIFPLYSEYVEFRNKNNNPKLNNLIDEAVEFQCLLIQMDDLNLKPKELHDLYGYDRIEINRKLDSIYKEFKSNEKDSVNNIILKRVVNWKYSYDGNDEIKTR